MKYMVRLTIKYICYGISWGCTCFVFMCSVWVICSKDSIAAFLLDDFVKHAAGSVLVGLACGGTAIVYQLERLSGIAKVLIHFGVGMGVFYPTALYLGWIPFYPERIWYTILQFLFSCGIFAAIWFCFYLFNRSEAKKINDRLQELNENDGQKNRPVP